MHADRRQLLFAAVAAAALPAGLARAAAPASPGAAKLNALFDGFMKVTFERSPELLTSLGMDKGEWAAAKAKLSDSSLAAIAEDKKINSARLAALKAFDRNSVTGLDRANYDTVLFTLEINDEANRQFDFGGQGAGSPYVVTQLTGSYQSMPDFLDNQHGIETKADADAYLSRMAAFATVLDQETEQVRHDVALGVVPPDFILDKTLTQMDAFLANAADKAPIVESVVRRTKEKNIPGDYAGSAAKIYDEKIVPALKRQAALIRSLKAGAVHDAGVWRLPKGEAYYATSLKQYTTSQITPAEVHKTGLELVASLSAEIDAIMTSQGLTQGTVGQRLRGMYDDPKFRYPNTDEGKEKLIADLNKKVEVVQAKLPAYFGVLPKAKVQIKRVPKAIEAGAPGGYYNSPSLDGSRPGIYWINLRDTAETPSWTLPTLTYHEAIPGHHLQGSISNEAPLPLIRKVIWFSGYGEGWALYAEQLAVEMGMYKDDPWGHIGMLHDALFRAVRLVVDSGMHSMKWSREKAVKYFVDTLGDQEASAVTEVERYCVWPGQACSYMVGKLTWLRLRAKAKAELGAKFDIHKFHDAGLVSGALPLTVLETVIGDYVKAGRA
ncbi:MAG: DUF885 family protein [Caulobacteraceae bacterium]|nr:DUF885 family protein [Caulobacteraceae bacterium]